MPSLKVGIKPSLLTGNPLLAVIMHKAAHLAIVVRLASPARKFQPRGVALRYRLCHNDAGHDPALRGDVESFPEIDKGLE